MTLVDHAAPVRVLWQAEEMGQAGQNASDADPVCISGFVEQEVPHLPTAMHEHHAAESCPGMNSNRRVESSRSSSCSPARSSYSSGTGSEVSSASTVTVASSSREALAQGTVLTPHPLTPPRLCTITKVTFTCSRAASVPPVNPGARASGCGGISPTRKISISPTTFTQSSPSSTHASHVADLATTPGRLAQLRGGSGRFRIFDVPSSAGSEEEVVVGAKPSGEALHSAVSARPVIIEDCYYSREEAREEAQKELLGHDS